MNKLLLKLTTAALTAALSLTVILSASGCDNSSEQPPQSEAVTSSSAIDDNELDLNSLHTFDKNGDKFAGIWKISDGAGSKLESFFYLFDGNGTANLVTGTSGYCGTYGFDENRFVCQLMFGINGKYDYTIKDDTIELVNIETEEPTTLKRVDSLDVIPKPFDDFSVDNSLLGAWQSDNGLTYYFDKSGIMYQNQYDTMYTYYSYSAKDGKITASSYIGKEKNDEELEYSLDDDILTISNINYKKIAASKVK